MNKNDLQKDLEKAIVETFNDLRTLYKRTGVPTTRLVFPKYNKTYRKDKNKNNKDEWRISEQEFRFVFIEKISEILEDNDLYYSIETPTESKYKFSKGGEKGKKPEINKQGKSAAFDLTIKDCDGNNVALIEFKAHSADSHEIAKDFCKLLNKNEGIKKEYRDKKTDLRYFINLFKRTNKNTISTLFDKMKPDEKNAWPDKKEEFEGQSVNLIIGVLSGTLDKTDKTEPKYKKYLVTIDGIQEKSAVSL